MSVQFTPRFTTSPDIHSRPFETPALRGSDAPLHCTFCTLSPLLKIKPEPLALQSKPVVLASWFNYIGVVYGS
jgi:hypothetical protein